MSKKGQNLLEKHLSDEVTISTENLFGETSAILGFDKDITGLKEYKELQKEPDKREAKEVELFGSVDLNADFVRKQEIKKEQNKVKQPVEKSEQESIYNSNALYENLFSEFDVEEIGSNEIHKEQETVLKPKMEQKEEIEKDLPKEEISTDGINDLDLARIKELTTSENYPSFFPDYEEILKLKQEHKDIIFVITGNMFEQFHYKINPELFICTTFKTSDYFDFIERGGDENNIGLFYPYLVTRSVLFPKIEFEDVFEIPAGTLQKIVENILINSKYKTSIEVVKL